MKNSILGKARWLREVALATSKNNGARVAREWLKYAAMFVMLFTIGSGNAWGAEDTSEFTSKAFEGLSNSWSKTSSGTLDYDATRGVQHQKSATTTFTAEGFSNVTKVQVWVAKSSEGAGSVKIQENNTAKKTISSFKTTLTEENYSWATPYTGTLKIVVKATASSIYIKKIVVTTSGCSECTYYVYNGSTWESIGTTGFNDVVLAPPTLPDNGHGAGNGCWVKDKTFFDGGCTRNINNNNNDYRFVPNPGGAPPTSVNKPGSGTCELYAVYLDGGCLSTTVTAVQCARIWEKPKPNTPSVSGSDVTLSWSSVTGASGYHLYVTDYDSYELDENVDGTSKTITGLAGGTYSWTVAANSPKDDACDSKASDGEDFEIVGCTDISGSTVTGVSVTPSKVGGSATWTAVANATSYEVKVYAGTATSGSALFSAEPTSNSCTITGLNASTQYTVVVKAKNSCSTSNQGKATWTTSALTLYTVTWSVNGSTYTTTENVSYNTTTSTPANPSVPGECTGSTFMGWTATENYSHATDAPGDLFNGTSPTITGDITFYAVFADEN